MINRKHACIFEHYGFIYVCDFDSMIVWVVFEEDDADPVTTLKLKRVSYKDWRYKKYDDCEDRELDDHFQYESDEAFVAKVEKNYELFINRLITEKCARRNSTKKTSKSNVWR